MVYIKDGATTGLATVNQLDEQFSLLSSVALLKPSRGLIDAYYLKWYLNHPVGFKMMTDQMTGSAITRLTLELIRSSVIPLPPLSEQLRIVAAVERIIEKVSSARTTGACAEDPQTLPPSRPLLRLLRPPNWRIGENELPVGWESTSVRDVLSEHLANGRSVPDAQNWIPCTTLDRDSRSPGKPCGAKDRSMDEGGGDPLFRQEGRFPHCSWKRFPFVGWARGARC